MEKRVTHRFRNEDSMKTGVESSLNFVYGSMMDEEVQEFAKDMYNGGKFSFVALFCKIYQFDDILFRQLLLRTKIAIYNSAKTTICQCQVIAQFYDILYNHKT